MLAGKSKVLFQCERRYAITARDVQQISIIAPADDTVLAQTAETWIRALI